jgi:GTP-binding protein
MSNRKGNMIEFKEIGDRLRMVFHAPSRGLLGIRYEVLPVTRGNATVNSAFSHYDVVPGGTLTGLKKGEIVSMETGKAVAFPLFSIEQRGVLFVQPQEEVYEGMVIGEAAKSGEMPVNPCREKQLSNMRSTGAETKIILQPPRLMNVEEMISYMDEDEVIEVTPLSIRLRKKILNTSERARSVKKRPA